MINKNGKQELPTICGMCDSSQVKTAMTCNEIRVCFSCLDFISGRARRHGVTEMEQLYVDTKYISLNPLNPKT